MIHTTYLHLKQDDNAFEVFKDIINGLLTPSEIKDDLTEEQEKDRKTYKLTLKLKEVKSDTSKDKI